MFVNGVIWGQAMSEYSHPTGGLRGLAREPGQPQAVPEGQGVFPGGREGERDMSLSGGSSWAQYGLALSAVAAVSVLNLWLQRWIGYEAIALVYLLAVVLLAAFVGRGPILLGTGLTALGWNFLFAPPRYSFHIGSFYDQMMLAMYFVVALVVGQLTARPRNTSPASS